MNNERKEKLETIVELVSNLMIDPDLDIEYQAPVVDEASVSEGANQDPYIIVKYTADKYLERKIRLRAKYCEKTAEEVANYVTFAIEQFKEEVDSLNYGAQ